ncbi:MAG: NAD+ synthase [Salinarchaeum sp.]
MSRVDSPLEQPVLELTFSEAELAERTDRITTFIDDMVERAGADGVVLGLSGGIDSTTVAYAAVEALGPDAVLGLSMPSTVTDERNITDAERIGEELDIRIEEIEIEPIVDAFLNAYPDAADDRMATGNLQVRIRAVLNYLLANAEDRLVLGTGNRSEAMTGYYTKYGDGAVDCHPLGNLYKCQVRQLARSLGVPEDLVTKTPSAEMWSGQSDEEELGLTYDTLDAILATHIDGPLSKSATAATLDIAPGTIEHVEDLVTASEHKRHMPPSPPSDTF